MADQPDDVFVLLADPTRRRILDLLAEHGVRAVGELVQEFPDLVPSGISKHLMALRAAGLVTATRDGRRQLYRIDGEGLRHAFGPWVARYDEFWSGSLERLRGLAEGAGTSGGDLHGGEGSSPESKGYRLILW
ncbi:transcriptional regulator [Agromyces rhizosphaerae]|uniref:Transcriptional regulator n=1 Tax=Agromyces rhizosphaerae TaxID=88374 RepID=A0A9W6FR26_9MICO|nr:metalloregulator ArsR/SmtB family transcription factor [Agromyces rhizosphaerae]GLI29130.1 transcriptional regulator [Agromyces rhizosphaerae]